VPDPPPRVLAPEPVKSGVLGAPGWGGVHGGGPAGRGRGQRFATSPGMTSPGGSGRPGPGWQICHAATSVIQGPAIAASPRSGAPGCRRPAAAVACGLPRRGHLGGWRRRQIRRASQSGAHRRPCPGVRGSAGMTRVRRGAKSRGPAWGVGQAPRGKKPLPG
jgi:hypothetical protein